MFATLSLPAKWIAAGLALSLVMLVLLMRSAGLSIDPWSPSNLPFAAAAGIALALRVAALRHPVPWLVLVARIAGYYAVLTAIVLIGAVSTYPLAALSHGFSDAALQRADRMLGFNWVGLYETVAAHRSLQLLGTAAYRSIYLTPAVILAWFAWEGRSDEVYRFLATFWLAAFLTLALYPLMPAIGPLSYLWHGALPYLPESEIWQQGLIPALRSGSDRVVDLGQLRGIVSAPSFHTASAFVYIAAGWQIVRLRWAVVAIDVAMLLSTPIEGTHYLSDMILGMLVALVAIAVVGFIAAERRRPAAPHGLRPSRV
ncbi:phosphatase PAP2 family protein [Sphingomonas sp. BAUL-RG-20F-R05-02]|uniref:phosphatase PAP2 family protein n=1 Tax=Sphingomonas sp. BAUL-RG-20F-R05-02 TaxID=2914830 RepID=UPI001F56F462|nr:phosphatase PAP2 family protein [Sphingomonas sp. BAUL-RG-20F-R05-02]